MAATLRNVDYPPDKLFLDFCVTDRLDKESAAYLIQVKDLFTVAKFPFKYRVSTTCLTYEEGYRWGPYYGVILNLHHSRLRFLDSDFDYFWVLGGDNPPPRNCLKKLLALKTDVASAMINQRPYRGRNFGKGLEPEGPAFPYPMFWEYVWTTEDIEKRVDFEPALKEALRKMWIEFAFMLPVRGKWKKVYKNVNFGSGCCLSTREVMEWCGFYLGNGYHSEDIHFFQNVLAHGFETALDTTVTCGHLDPGGDVY